MDQTDLDRDQLDQLDRLLHPGANLLVRLMERMAKAGFPGKDPLYLTVMEAHSILQRLCAQVRYLSADRRKKERGSPAAHPSPRRAVVARLSHG
jgi:hypothetical protein